MRSYYEHWLKINRKHFEDHVEMMIAPLYENKVQRLRTIQLAIKLKD